jgi:hypothetical protein
MRLLIRALIGLVATGLLVLAAWGLDYGFWFLTTDDTEGGAFVFGLFVFPAAVVVGLVGFGLFALAIRP